MILRTRRSLKPFVLVIVGLVTAAALAALVMLLVYGETNGTLVSSGETRHYLLYVPKSYNRAAPTPLVISLHAFGLTPVWQKQISDWNRLADEFGFIVVYPAGTGVPKLWRAKLDDGGKYDIGVDVAFISDLVDELQRKYTIDSKRIYVNGFSNGGGMAYALYCRLSYRIAAIGLVAGAILLPWDKCHATQPTPVIAFHGTKDPITFYRGGYSKLFKVTFPFIQDWINEFSRRNMCAGPLSRSAISSEVTRLLYSHCARDANVVLYTIEGGGHTWPGDRPLHFFGHTTRDVDATRVTWEFFSRHSLSD
jgi:polyhydroxybutyrate depolymerase